MRRSQLYVPANNEQKIRKSVTLDADEIILDLEDAVPQAEKQKARDLLKSLFHELDWGKKAIWIRANPPTTNHFLKDLELVSSLDALYGVVIPKAEESITWVNELCEKSVMPLVETPRGLLSLEKLVRSEGVVAVGYGAADFALFVGGSVTQYSSNVYIKSALVITASAYGVDAVDNVFFDLSDIEGFVRQAQEARALGFVGKQVIHPTQIPHANRIFSPTEEEVSWAKSVIQAYEEAESKGKGALKVQDKLVDAVHYRIARRILDAYERLEK